VLRLLGLVLLVAGLARPAVGANCALYPGGCNSVAQATTDPTSGIVIIDPCYCPWDTPMATNLNRLKNYGAFTDVARAWSAPQEFGGRIAVGNSPNAIVNHPLDASIARFEHNFTQTDRYSIGLSVTPGLNESGAFADTCGGGTCGVLVGTDVWPVWAPSIGGHTLFGIYGTSIRRGVAPSGGVSATVSNAIGLNVPAPQLGTNVTLGVNYGAYFGALTSLPSGTSVGVNFGLVVDDQTAGTINRGIVTGLGLNHLGDNVDVDGYVETQCAPSSGDCGATLRHNTTAPAAPASGYTMVHARDDGGAYVKAPADTGNGGRLLDDRPVTLATFSTLAVGAFRFCSDCTVGSNPCTTGGSTGTWAMRINTGSPTNRCF
jgi:hypothetical protein